jgi:glutamyl-tRNA synthetase
MPSESKPRVRFAPSPTGYLHVGGARTALFNWLFARREGGTFILRVEDTDVERNRLELVEGILESLRWLGLDWDEGPVFQSQRLESYRAAAQRVLEAGRAYLCFCAPSSYAGADAAPEEAEDETAEAGTPATAAARSAGAAAPAKTLRKSACSCRNLSAEERAAKRGRGEPAAIRFHVPEGGATQFEDAVFGPREVANEEMEDFVLLRSNGAPTYQLGAVVDDIAMGITHVIRGADHLSNTPKQVLLYRALGAEPPIFAHVPLILGPDRSRMSKRHGATSVASYKDEGFLPEAFRNFLALLGWSPGGDVELLSSAEMIERFSLGDVSRTNAVFDRAKLEWFNQQYLQKLPLGTLVPAVEAELLHAGLWREEWATGAGREWFSRTVDLLRPRTRLLPDFSHWGRAFFSDEFEYEAAAREKFWKEPRLAEWFPKLARSYEAQPEWNHDACDKTLRDLAAAENVKAGVLINATRVAIVGVAVAPPLFDTMVALGRERVVSRLRRAVAQLQLR